MNSLHAVCLILCPGRSLIHSTWLRCSDLWINGDEWNKLLADNVLSQFLTQDCSFKLLKSEHTYSSSADASKITSFTFPIDSDLFSFSASYIYFLYVELPLKSTIAEGSCHWKEKYSFTLTLQHHSWHLDSPKWLSKIFQKDKKFVFKLSFQWTLSLQAWNHCSNHLFYGWLCGSQWCECTFEECSVWLLIIGGDGFHDVLCLTFPELLPVSFNQEQQLACT